MTDFDMSINGEEPIIFTSKHTEHRLAVLEAFGSLSLDYPCKITIWVNRLLPDYPPLNFVIDDFIDSYGNVYGCPAVMDFFEKETLNT